EFVAKVAEMGNRPAEGCHTQLQKGCKDLACSSLWIVQARGCFDRSIIHRSRPCPELPLGCPDGSTIHASSGSANAAILGRTPCAYFWAGMPPCLAVQAFGRNPYSPLPGQIGAAKGPEKLHMELPFNLWLYK